MKQELMRLENVVYVSYGKRVLDGLTFSVYKGEILFLMGLSDSGIDIITDVLSGENRIDSGTIYFEEEKVSISSKTDSRRLGIHCAHSASPLVPNFTVAEALNISKRNNPQKGIIKRREMYKDAAKILSDLKLGISPNELCRYLSPVNQRIIEIIECISMGIKLIVINDFNVDYTRQDILMLSKIIKYYVSQGISFIICAHNDNNWKGFFSQNNRLIVLREGKNVKTLYPEDFEKHELVSYLTGRELNDTFNRVSINSDQVVVRIENLANSSRLNGISFNLKAGEIFGLLDFGGTTNPEIARILSGIDRKYGGSIYLDDKKIVLKNQREAIRNGIVYMPDGVSITCPVPESMSVAENLSLLLVRKKKKRNWIIDKKTIRFIFDENRPMLELTEIPGDMRTSRLPINAKLRLFYLRWIIAMPKLLVCVNPTSSLDMVLKNTMWQLLDKAANKGVAVLILTSNLNEASQICDRVAIISRGTIIGVYEKSVLSQLELSDYC